jgi:hypothetical protein
MVAREAWPSGSRKTFMGALASHSAEWVWRSVRMNPALNAGLVGQPPQKLPVIRLLEPAAVERAEELATAVVSKSRGALATHRRSRGRGSVPSTMELPVSVDSYGLVSFLLHLPLVQEQLL